MRQEGRRRSPNGAAAELKKQKLNAVPDPAGRDRRRSSTSRPTRRRSTSWRRPMPASTPIGHFVDERIPSRFRDQFPEARADQIEYMDVSPEAGRLRRDRADPVPRARRRQPRADGLEHAAPGRAAAASPRRRSSAPAWRSAPRATPARWSSRSATAWCISVTAERIRVESRLGRARRVPAAQVRAQQPGHLHQPAPDRRPGPAGPGRPGHRRQLVARATASSRSARTSSSRS